MVNIEKISKLLDCFIEKDLIKTKELKELDFSQNDINKLLDNGYLIREKRGYYKASNKILLKHAIKKIKEFNFSKAEQILLKLNERDKENKVVIFFLFYINVFKNNYVSAKEYLKILLEEEKEIFNVEHNFYLYLLSNLTDLDDELKDKLKNISLNDILVKNDNRYKNIELENEVRKNVFDGKFKEAFDLIKNSKNFKSNLTEALILRNINKEKIKTLKEKKLDLIKNEDYEEVLNIINNKIHLSHHDVLTKKLLEVLIEYKKSNKIVFCDDIFCYSVCDAIEMENYKSAYDFCKAINNYDKLTNEIYLLLKEVNTIINYEKQKEDNLNKKIKYLRDKCEKLCSDKGLIFLNNIGNNDIPLLEEILKDYEDIKLQEVNGNIILKYTHKVQGYVNVKNIIERAKDAYLNGDYERSIDNSKAILSLFDEPRPDVYANIGKNYLRLYKKKEALPYLIMAQKKSKFGKSFDFSNIIDQIKNNNIDKISKEDYDLGLDCFEDMNEFINETNMDVESAGLETNMSLEDINLLKLAYAKRYYSKGYFLQGDLFLNSVEKTSNKTPLINQYLYEIKKNKKFYKNRPEENPIPISLTLKPGPKKS